MAGCSGWLLLLMMSGCGERGPVLVPVKGKLLDKVGNPIFPGSVWFIVDGQKAEGPGAAKDASSLLHEDGSFTLRTYPYGEGAMVGRYRVTISLGAGSSPRLAKYAGPKTSDVVVDVPEQGLTDLVVRLGEEAAFPDQSSRKAFTKGRR